MLSMQTTPTTATLHPRDDEGKLLAWKLYRNPRAESVTRPHIIDQRERRCDQSPWRHRVAVENDYACALAPLGKRCPWHEREWMMQPQLFIMSCATAAARLLRL